MAAIQSRFRFFFGQEDIVDLKAGYMVRPDSIVVSVESDEGDLEIDDVTAPVVRRIFEMRLDRFF